MTDRFQKSILEQAGQNMVAEAAILVEQLRCKRVRSLGVIDTPPEEIYNDIVAIAAYVCKMDGAVLTFIDDETAFIKANFKGNTGREKREDAFCNIAIRTPRDMMVIPDASLDKRFSTNPKVVSNLVRFYAGMPLLSDDGYALGALCVIDPKPQQYFSEEQSDMLMRLARIVTELVTRKKHT